MLKSWGLARQRQYALVSDRQSELFSAAGVSPVSDSDRLTLWTICWSTLAESRRSWDFLLLREMNLKAPFAHRPRVTFGIQSMLVAQPPRCLTEQWLFQSRKFQIGVWPRLGGTDVLTNRFISTSHSSTVISWSRSLKVPAKNTKKTEMLHCPWTSVACSFRLTIHSWHLVSDWRDCHRRHRRWTWCACDKMPCWWQNNCRAFCDTQNFCLKKKRMLQAASPWEEANLFVHRYSSRWPWSGRSGLILLCPCFSKMTNMICSCSVCRSVRIFFLRSPCFLICKIFLRCWCWNSWLVGLDKVYLCCHKHAPPQNISFSNPPPPPPHTHTHTLSHTAATATTLTLFSIFLDTLVFFYGCFYFSLPIYSQSFAKSFYLPVLQETRACLAGCMHRTPILMFIFYENWQSYKQVKMQTLPCNTPLFLLCWSHSEPSWRLKKEYFCQFMCRGRMLKLKEEKEKREESGESRARSSGGSAEPARPPRW